MQSYVFNYCALFTASSTAGDKGFIGDIGFRGKSGRRGKKGPNGTVGDKGEKGVNGSKGDMGEKGNKGMKGDKGVSGRKGPSSPQGQTGGKHVSFAMSFYAQCNYLSSQQINIYETFDDLMATCIENETPPTDGCLAFVSNTKFIYIQMPGDDCIWLPWVSRETRERFIERKRERSFCRVNFNTM